MQLWDPKQQKNSHFSKLIIYSKTVKFKKTNINWVFGYYNGTEGMLVTKHLWRTSTWITTKDFMYGG